jgi:hypothetical protein
VSTYEVTVGDWDRRTVYSGSNLFAAGLHAARAERDRSGALNAGTVQVQDPDNCDDDKPDGLTDDAHDFISGCIDIGSALACRKRRAA